MSRIISFAWTTPALLAGRKTCTRRDWDHDYAARFSAGEVVQAFNRSPRARGVQLATIRLTAAPTYEPTSSMPDSDYEAEGFDWMAANPLVLPKTRDGWPLKAEDVVGWNAFREWQRRDDAMYVIRFEIVALNRENILKHVTAAHRELILAGLPPDRRERHAWMLESSEVPA